MTEDKRDEQRQLREQTVKRQVYMIAIGGILVLTALLFWGSSMEKKAAKKVVESAKIEEKTNTTDAKASLGAILQMDQYGKELAEIYQQYPQLEKLLLNRENYPDWLIEYFIGHREAVDWVVDYPEYSAKAEEEINNTALTSVNLKDYQIQNGIPLYLQWDQTWGYAAYGNGLVAVDGCGPTCLAMVATGLLGDTSLTPKKMADFSIANGYYTSDNLTDWNLMMEGAEKLGLQVEDLTDWNKSTIIETLKKGKPIICSMGPGDFTTQGHFIVLVGVTEDDKVIVNDPNSRINSRKKWDAQVLLDQMKVMWGYSVK